MSEHRRIPEPGETIQLPRASWAPAFFALGAVGAVAGIYANGFVFSAFIWSYVGIVVLLFAFRAMVKTGVRGYYNLPRRQQARTGTLPVDQFSLETRPSGESQPR
ncbi:MAG TPA: hypothetical protein VMH33_05445 [Solirubrobacterales bacterium]|nr:hypothetical protein [Solirubrobacterales bacterium]